MLTSQSGYSMMGQKVITMLGVGELKKNVALDSRGRPCG
ncbi:hypothetical protein EV11_0821 [Prochlorococcus sp. SS52]|nr:hypothetical protein EV11_0821 [Prochlorococcus sp. SS52]